MVHESLIKEVDIPELVKAMRSASTVSTAWEKLMLDAAAAIEELQAEVQKYHDAFGRLSKTAVELKQRIAELKGVKPQWVQDDSISAFADGEWWKEVQE